MADDRQIDESLRDLPVPDAVSRRCTADVVFDDEAIDRGLLRIAVPSDLAERILRRSRRPGRRVPIDLDRRGGWIAEPVAPNGRARLVRFHRAVVSCVGAAGMLAVPLAVFAGVFLTGRALSRRLERPAAARAVARSTAAVPPPVSSRPEPVVREEVAADLEATAVVPAPAAPAAAASAAAPVVLGAAVDTDGVHDLAMRFAPPLGDVRREVPRLRGYDLAFEMLHGEHPFVMPAAAPGLAVSRPPLATGIDTFRAFVERGGRRGGVPRVEEMLAALPGPDALPDDIRVTTRGVAGCRRRDGRQTALVEVAIVAPRGEAVRPPVDATVVLARPVTGGVLAWQWTCAALGGVARAMAPDDRLTVIVADGSPAVVARRAAAAEVGAIAEMLVAWPVSIASDLDAAVREAESFASPVVLVAGAEVLDGARAEARRALGDWQARMAAGGEAAPAEAGSSPVSFVVVDAGLAALTDDAATFGRTPLDSVAIRRALVREVFGGPQDVAGDCRLEVAFAPRSVAAYRLVGHRQSAVESAAASGPSATTLHAGELVRAVYEIVLVDAAAGRLIEAVCRWQPRGAEPARERRAVLDVADIDAFDPLPGPAACELLLTAGVGDLLADSPHAMPRAAVRDALESLARRWRERGDVTPAGDRAITALDAAGRGGS